MESSQIDLSEFSEEINDAGVGGHASGGDAPHSSAPTEPASASGGDAQHSSASTEPASASGEIAHQSKTN